MTTSFSSSTSAPADLGAERRRDDDLERERRELDYLGLPVAFQRRIDRFKRANPAFEQHFESYELNCCTQAVLIAERLGTAGEVERFFAIRSWDEQKSLVPGLDPGHSGHSLAVACKLAYKYLTAPYLVEYEHGALAPLVGCEAYGCEHPQPPTA